MCGDLAVSLKVGADLGESFRDDGSEAVTELFQVGVRDLQTTIRDAEFDGRVSVRGQVGAHLAALDRGDLVAVRLAREHRFHGVAVRCIVREQSRGKRPDQDGLQTQHFGALPHDFQLCIHVLTLRLQPVRLTGWRSDARVGIARTSAGDAGQSVALPAQLFERRVAEPP
ncbi:hypothetical protein [Microbacterium saperdae]|uniref:hypothetical protein n=1 Tax=Microbacterium saperdae TaxID=69368 RepID=UPI0014773911|nr:hypothetical protein [Microbacterium saperdae]GGM55983.1 hypothetical protein GCM10010489_29460 [Microbacterium saperdae]